MFRVNLLIGDFKYSFVVIFHNNVGTEIFDVFDLHFFDEW